MSTCLEARAKFCISDAIRTADTKGLEYDFSSLCRAISDLSKVDFVGGADWGGGLKVKFCRSAVGFCRVGGGLAPGTAWGGGGKEPFKPGEDDTGGEKFVKFGGEKAGEACWGAGAYAVHVRREWR